MPSSSVDTFLACSIMIALVLSAMVGTSKLMAPYLNDLSHKENTERFYQLAMQLLQSPGRPSGWGQLKDAPPESIGLAKANSSIPYELDIDKVTRLSNESAYCLTYPEMWQAFGIQDVSYQIQIRTLFEISIDMISSSAQGGQTTYEFEVDTIKSGMPIPASLCSYIVVRDFVDKVTSCTSLDGTGTITVDVPNSVNGTAFLLVLAKAQANPQIVSYQTYAFNHHSSTPLPNRTFARLSPVDHVLHVTLIQSEVEILEAQIFTFNHNFTLAEKQKEAETIEYFVPQLLDSSPTIMVLTGQNGSTSFAEWVSYPTIPLQMGANFDESTAGSKIDSISHIVTINSALYEALTRWGST